MYVQIEQIANKDFASICDSVSSPAKDVAYISSHLLNKTYGSSLSLNKYLKKEGKKEGKPQTLAACPTKKNSRQRRMRKKK
jgi:hypothetical protein